MNISKAQSGIIGLPAGENDQPSGYSKFEVYGIHNLKFVDRVGNATNSPSTLSGMPPGAPRELEVEVQAGPCAPDDTSESRQNGH